ncbi:MAG: thioredoxin [Lachnospiraceae bacterium]|nr:thioredoxin [Lachnospiraceae bacterium]
MEYKFTTANFEEEVLNSDVPVLVDFYADWCNPCKMMAPVVEKLAEELAGSCKVGKCNVDENMAVAQKYRVVNIPTFIVFKSGQPVSTFRGAMSAQELRSNVEAAIK